MARRFWGAKGAIGEHIRFFGENLPVEIVGVVKDSTYISLGEDPRLMVYLCLNQNYTPSATLWFRGTGDPAASLDFVRRQVQSLDRDVLLSNPQTVTQVSRELLWAQRLGAVLFASFGALAGVLTVVGLYGVMSYLRATRHTTPV